MLRLSSVSHSLLDACGRNGLVRIGEMQLKWAFIAPINAQMGGLESLQLASL